MLKLKKLTGGRSPYWYVRGKVKGHLVFESTGTSDKASAEAYRRRREAEVYEYLALGKRPPTTFSDAALAYLNGGGDILIYKQKKGPQELTSRPKSMEGPYTKCL